MLRSLQLRGLAPHRSTNCHCEVCRQFAIPADCDCGRNPELLLRQQSLIDTRVEIHARRIRRRPFPCTSPMAPVHRQCAIPAPCRCCKCRTPERQSQFHRNRYPAPQFDQALSSRLTLFRRSRDGCQSRVSEYCIFRSRPCHCVCESAASTLRGIRCRAGAPWVFAPPVLKGADLNRMPRNGIYSI